LKHGSRAIPHRPGLQAGRGKPADLRLTVTQPVYETNFLPGSTCPFAGLIFSVKKQAAAEPWI